jgi:hypothetical protein
MDCKFKFANIHTSVMSPNATLLSYTDDSDIKALRDQAALISILWREAEQQNKQKNPNSQNTDLTFSNMLKPGDLETLTVESETSNIIVRAIQPRLLLVLVGGKPPTYKTDLKFFKITPETVGDVRYPPADSIPSPPPAISSSSSSSSAANEAVQSQKPNQGMSSIWVYIKILVTSQGMLSWMSCHWSWLKG